MILAIFVVLMTLSLIFVVLGLTFSEHTEFAIIGFFFIFLLSFNLYNGTIEYKIGSEEIYIYGNNFTGYHWDYNNPLEPRPQDPDMAYLFHKEILNTYETYQDKQLGFWLSVTSLFSIILILFNLKKTNWSKE